MHLENHYNQTKTYHLYKTKSLTHPRTHIWYNKVQEYPQTISIPSRRVQPHIEWATPQIPRRGIFTHQQHFVLVWIKFQFISHPHQNCLLAPIHSFYSLSKALQHHLLKSTLQVRLKPQQNSTSQAQNGSQKDAMTDGVESHLYNFLRDITDPPPSFQTSGRHGVYMEDGGVLIQPWVSVQIVCFCLHLTQYTENIYLPIC